MKLLPTLVFLAASLISIGSIRADAQTFEASVPFGFNVGSHVLPAGLYKIGYITHDDHNFIDIRSKDGRLHALSVNFAAASDHKSSAGGQIVFLRYGNQYFLHQVLWSAAGIEVELPRSLLRERTRIRKAQQSPTEIAVMILHEGAR